MNWMLLAVFLFAILEWIATAKGIKRLEYFVKPATLLTLIAWVVVSMVSAGSSSSNLIWFVVGLVLCLFGDIFLMLPPERWFLPGLVAFLLGHIAYIIGFRTTSIIIGTAIPIIFLLLLLVVVGIGVFQRIRAGLISSGREKLVLPVAVYSMIISLMVFSAAYSFLDPDWTTVNAYIVTLGALIFYISDILNAWERFIVSFNNARLIIMITYYLGQIGVTVGATFHFLS